MSLRSRLERLEKTAPPADDEPTVTVYMPYKDGGPGSNTLPPGEHVLYGVRYVIYHPEERSQKAPSAG